MSADLSKGCFRISGEEIGKLSQPLAAALRVVSQHWMKPGTAMSLRPSFISVATPLYTQLTHTKAEHDERADQDDQHPYPPGQG